jgi:phosphoglycerol transferase
MDTTLVSGLEDFDRTVYNCFINSEKNVEELNLTNRIFTAMDIFPTVLSALGFEIEGNRLGLGTDLFSSEKTLPEALGFETIEEETNKYSKYYIDHFS